MRADARLLEAALRLALTAVVVALAVPVEVTIAVVVAPSLGAAFTLRAGCVTGGWAGRTAVPLVALRFATAIATTATGDSSPHRALWSARRA
ncbi:MAG: hypothetical protein ACLQK4_00695 [Acidimicrobiales bacterium]